MTERILALDDLKQRTLEDVLREVAKRQEAMTVRLPEGDLVAIKPSPPLKELPMLDGSIPQGWKDAIYE